MLTNPSWTKFIYQTKSRESIFSPKGFSMTEREINTALEMNSPTIIDTYYVRTYNVFMNVTLSLDDQVVAQARKRALAVGKSLNQLIRDYLQTLVDDDPESSIAEFKSLSGRGNSQGWRFNRDEIHDRP
jgi:hypothetical protein